MTDAAVAEWKRKAGLLDELRVLSMRYQIGGVFQDVLWDVSEEKPKGDPWPDALRFPGVDQAEVEA
jgi:hypothetical protein